MVLVHEALEEERDPTLQDTSDMESEGKEENADIHTYLRQLPSKSKIKNMCKKLLPLSSKICKKQKET